ncbi:hypothetical protein L226DRAFT_608960 [Lentinus tigrinus ALCF2SS1-7]|uniref:Uncharacterized protein n=1 Tax=Lentinus tigrinus ALCF2SS1-6 TaxID=1328759 RepID=A0A5C2SZP0_9APHY|nr:hypothetical protein L227DRAFT_130793 [Lentinus tigrinus ALCF2SS1-6]RPD79983.1 hypothetical protein L226DRAFT_608960 [Lentinus tigrinus ALCF2SS1-7]
MPFSGPGIYQIAHAQAASIHLAVSEGSKANGTPIIVSNATGSPFNQMWIIESVTSEDDTYTIRNISTGLFLGLQGGELADGTFAVGYQRMNHDSMKWVIRQEETDGTRWKIQNKICYTFLELHGSLGAGTLVVGWSGLWKDNGPSGQQWLFEMLSRTSDDIHTALQKCPCIKRDFKSYLSDGLYLVLSRDTMRQIWNNSGLAEMRWRDSIFDCDDFATVFKAEVGKWGNETFSAGGFALLCGLMFGDNQGDAHAYNWTLDTNDLSRVIFFEPQEGQFSNTSSYTAYFGLF